MSTVNYKGYKLRQIRSIVEVTTPEGDIYPIIAQLPAGLLSDNADTKAYRSDINHIILAIGKTVKE